MYVELQLDLGQGTALALAGPGAAARVRPVGALARLACWGCHLLLITAHPADITAGGQWGLGGGRELQGNLHAVITGSQGKL